VERKEENRNLVFIYLKRKRRREDSRANTEGE
jgi:hypothetical protein